MFHISVCSTIETLHDLSSDEREANRILKIKYLYESILLFLIITIFRIILNYFKN